MMRPDDDARLGLDMQTTVTLDEDVKALLTHAAQRSGKSLEAALNDTVRKALAPSAAVADVSPPVWPTFRMGPPLVDLTKANALAGELEDEYLIVKLRRGA